MLIVVWYPMSQSVTFPVAGQIHRTLQLAGLPPKLIQVAVLELGILIQPEPVQSLVLAQMRALIQRRLRST